MSKLKEYKDLSNRLHTLASLVANNDAKDYVDEEAKQIVRGIAYLAWAKPADVILDLLNRLKIAEDALKTYAVAEGQMIVDEKTREPIDSNIAKAALEVINE